MKRRVIIDTDPGVDDALAILLALNSAELEVEAITTVFGNVCLEQAVKNAGFLLDFFRPEKAPLLARGASGPMGKSEKKIKTFHGSDGLGGLSQKRNNDGTPKYPYPEAPKDLPDATEVISNLLELYQGEITIICLGPLTNLANTITKDKRAVKRVGEVVIMGGAISVPGNITPASEVNIHMDPYAARQVFRSGLPIKLIPLDVTEKVFLAPQMLEDLVRSAGSIPGDFLKDLTVGVMDKTEKTRGIRGIQLHDPLAVAVAVDPSLVTARPVFVDVETKDGITRGLTLADLRPIKKELKKPPNIHVAFEVSAGRFFSFFKEDIWPK